MLPQPVVQALRDHRRRQQEEAARLGDAWEGAAWGHLVFSDEAGRPLAGFHAARRLRRLLEAAGLPRRRYHDLLHGAASLMAAQGVPVRTAIEILGHSDIGTTMNIYAHLATEMQRDAAARVAGALWQGS